MRPPHCRAWRPQPGPPSHVVERQIALQLKFAEARRKASEAAATRSIEQIEPVVVPLRRSESVPSVALAARLPAARSAHPKHRFFTRQQFAACLLVAPSLLTGALASFIASRRDAPIPAPEIVVASRPSPAVERRREIDFAAILPAPALPRTAPAIDRPGEIRFSGLRLPDLPPDVPAVLPGIAIPPRDFAMAGSPPSIAAPPPTASADIAVPPLSRSVAVLSADLTPPVMVDATSPPAEQCFAETGFTLLANPKLPAAATAPDGETSAEFGLRLAQAARTQTASLVIYNARYTRIAYPAGDVSPFYGVCTDVVIRAYRMLGIDLQVEVADAGVGSGDRSIDHRRVEVMRKFMAKRGESLPASDNPDDYLAGDVVTYYRPQNKSSTAHVAIVSDTIGPSGQPMIIHNRGWGVQLEDALFVDKITGHYRYRPKPRTGEPAIAIVRPGIPNDLSLAEPPRIRPKTPDGAALAKAGAPARALR